MKRLVDFNLKAKRVLLRCDFNVPLKGKEILDDFRIKATIPTIEYLIERGAKIILMSHLDDPKGKFVEDLKLDGVQEKLMEYLDLSIVKAPDCIGEEIEKWTKEMEEGEILLLENLRFHKEEEENDEEFSKKLSRLGDIYINDAFGVSHRKHASIVGVPKFLDSGIGLLMEKEINNLNRLIENPQKPLVAIIGGKKIEDKSRVINRISEFADFILVNHLIFKEIKEKGIEIKYPFKILPPIDGIEENGEFLDIGPKTISLFKEKIQNAKTVFWAGPLGKIEDERYTKGSEEIANAIVKSNAFSVAGGGETIEFINKINLSFKFSHISTGGGAMLVYLSGEKLVGLEALNLKS
jgi:phosphoglycerate kinase